MGNELFSLGQRVMWLEPSFGIMVGRIIAVIDTPDGCFYNVVFDNKISSCVSVKILPLKGKDLLSLESRDMKEYKHNDGTAEKTKELLRALADVMDDGNGIRGAAEYDVRYERVEKAFDELAHVIGYVKPKGE